MFESEVAESVGVGVVGPGNMFELDSLELLGQPEGSFHVNLHVLIRSLVLSPHEFDG